MSNTLSFLSMSTPISSMTPKIGDLVTIEGSGAYCSGMSTKNYNSFPESAEVILSVSGDAHVIRK